MNPSVRAPWYKVKVADRVQLPDSVVDKLFFAQVREDPLLEIEALEPAPDETIVVVGSGGCTALSLLAAGAGRVVAVDLNRAQNSLTELKAAAVTTLPPADALAFLGGPAMSEEDRRQCYEAVASELGQETRAWWDAHPKQLERGVLGAGVTERFIGGVITAMRLAIHPPGRMRRMLACRTIEEQRSLYREEWDTVRWRLLFTVLLNRAVFRKTYHPGFFEHVENPSFAQHFRSLAEHTLTEIPISTNYFVHHMFTGAYPAGVPGGLPPYLNAPLSPDRLTLVDGSYTAYLRTVPEASVNGFAVSNILEWLTPEQSDELFAEVVRTAAPGARFVFRNFVGWNEVPERWREVVVEDRARGEEMIKRDRSAVQRRIAVCRVK
jgi:S-adenosylmethionine-diacylglycerol 3-amino-3-carboxypropyl transferase